MQYELKLATGRRVIWEGADGEEAARRYVDAHREAAVVAWRGAPPRRPSHTDGLDPPA